jgi:hypothetical protein
MIRTNQTHKNYIGTKPVIAEVKVESLSMSETFLAAKKNKPRWNTVWISLNWVNGWQPGLLRIFTVI